MKTELPGSPAAAWSAQDLVDAGGTVGDQIADWPERIGSQMKQEIWFVPLAGVGAANLAMTRALGSAGLRTFEIFLSTDGTLAGVTGCWSSAPLDTAVWKTFHAAFDQIDGARTWTYTGQSPEDALAAWKLQPVDYGG